LSGSVIAVVGHGVDGLAVDRLAVDRLAVDGLAVDGLAAIWLGRRFSRLTRHDRMP
jgi:hypothetical protein